MSQLTMDEAIEAAIRMNRLTPGGDVAAAFPELERAVQDFERQGYPIESIIPGGKAASLGFSFTRVDGKTFFDVYARLIRDKLCTKDGEFNKLIENGLSSSVGAVLTAIVTALGIPLVALGVMIPVAVIITKTGLEAFCEVTEPRPEPKRE